MAALCNRALVLRISMRAGNLNNARVLLYASFTDCYNSILPRLLLNAFIRAKSETVYLIVIIILARL